MSGSVQDAAGDALGPAPLVGGPLPDDGRSPRRAIKVSPALVAARLAARPGKGLTLLLTTSEARADEIGRALAGMADPTLEVLVLPPWDCLPYDHASPSRESQGRRLAVLHRLADPADRRVLVTSPEAALQRLPPPDARSATFHLRVGEALDREALEAFARRTGYVVDDRIDEPGEIAFLGEVIDIYPAAEQRPVRLVLADGGSTRCGGSTLCRNGPKTHSTPSPCMEPPNSTSPTKSRERSAANTGWDGSPVLWTASSPWSRAPRSWSRRRPGTAADASWSRSRRLMRRPGPSAPVGRRRARPASI